MYSLPTHLTVSVISHTHLNESHHHLLTYLLYLHYFLTYLSALLIYLVYTRNHPLLLQL
nr:MAG TPA: hypothetical protein [Bacteriophage sp.]